MYAAERQQALAERVSAYRRVGVAEAADAFGVTTETVRRDLALLERRGLVHRVHGGAVPADALTVREPGLAERHRVAMAQKDRIARAALTLVPRSGGSILLDAGSTTARLARALPADVDLSVVTNSPAIATLLSDRASERLDIRLLGGRIRPRSGAAVGATTVGVLADVRVDVTFLGVNGLRVDFGPTTPDADEAAVKAAMARSGRRVVLLCDSTKFGEETMARFVSLDQVDAVVTDDGVSPADKAALEHRDIEVVVA